MLEKCLHASVDCGASKIGITDNDPATATNRRLASTIRKPPIEHAAGPLGSTSRAGHRSYGGVAS